MSVTTTWKLPEAIPNTSSNVNLVPLGGNGYTAPHSYYGFLLFSAGDASGGVNTVQVGFDERYTSIPAYFMVQVRGMVADINYELLLNADNVDNVAQRDVLTLLTIAGQAQDGEAVWRPPPFIMQGRSDAAPVATSPPYIRAQFNNLDAEDYILIGRVYNFAIDARQVTPLQTLLAVLPS